MLIPAHPLTENWFSSSLPFLVIFLAVYLGVHYMFWIPENDNDYPKYREISLVKNIIVAFCNAVLGYAMISSMYGLKYSLTCEPVSHDGNKMTKDPNNKNTIPNYMLLFLSIKILECLDTLVQIVREDSTSYWLLMHHSSIVAIAWLGLRITPGGTAAILASINCVSHAIVYAYLAATYFSRYVGIDLRDFPDIINHGQFFTILYLAHTSIHRECGFPVFASGFLQAYVAGLIVLWHCF